MSIIISPKINCFSELREIYPARVVASPEDGRTFKAFSSLKIGIVNLMPTKEVTEKQWSALLLSYPKWIEPIWIHMESYTPKNVDQNYLNEAYIGTSNVEFDTLDGLIITGAPVEQLKFEKVLYWQELSFFLERAMSHYVPMLSVCWGAQALLYKRFDIEKWDLEEKCFGVFEHQVTTEHPLTKALPEKIHLPHSRHTGWKREALLECQDLKILIESEGAGVFALEDGDGNVYWSGHPEYEVETLLLEYERDLAKELDIRAPMGYRKLKNGKWEATFKWHETAKILVHNWICEIG